MTLKRAKTGSALQKKRMNILEQKQQSPCAFFCATGFVVLSLLHFLSNARAWAVQSGFLKRFDWCDLLAPLLRQVKRVACSASVVC